MGKTKNMQRCICDILYFLHTDFVTLYQTWVQNCRQDHKGNSAWPAWIKLSTDICVVNKIKIYYILGGLIRTIAHETVNLLSMVFFVHYHL